MQDSKESYSIQEKLVLSLDPIRKLFVAFLRGHTGSVAEDFMQYLVKQDSNDKVLQKQNQLNTLLRSLETLLREDFAPNWKSQTGSKDDRNHHIFFAASKVIFEVN